MHWDCEWDGCINNRAQFSPNALAISPCYNVYNYLDIGNIYA